MKLSVAITTYNQEQYIGQAIESVLAQNVNFAYEIVIGEDCSTDGTRDVVTSFHGRYPERIKLLLRDQNVGAMRNFAETIEACQSEYLALLDGDDYWIATDKLQKQINFLDAHPECAICCGRVRALYHAGMQDLDVRPDVFPQLPAGPYTIEDILKANFLLPCTAVLKRKYISQFPKWFFEMKVGDWPLCTMVARYGTIELMDEIMAAYRIHPGGVWSSMPQAIRAEQRLQVLRALDKELRYEYRNAIREAVASVYRGLACDSRSRGKRIETARHMVNYVRSGGWHCPGGARVIASMITYEVIGPWYRVFSRTDSSKRS
jgi:glycosyltransferase involved in cell wall biosynthesis